ncbi:MAG: hypothetical protein ABL958_00975 [Bdellovibrionia bacterium]
MRFLLFSALLLASFDGAQAAGKITYLKPAETQTTQCPGKGKEKSTRKIFCTDPTAAKAADYGDCGENGITCVIIGSGETLDVCGGLYSCP